jgi:hypothetical protein
MIATIALGLLVLLVVLAVVGTIAGWTRHGSNEAPLSSAPVGPAWAGRLLPDDPVRSFAAAVVAGALLGVALVLLGLYGSSRTRYGWTIFVVAPFAVGFVAAWLTSYRQAPTVRRFVGAGALAAVTAGLGFFALGAEGAVCLLMSAPITVPCAVVGALTAFLLRTRRRSMPTMAGMVVCLVPFGMAAEPALLGAPPERTVRSAVDIDAPPSAVWAHLVEFEPISARVDSWLFRAGVAYPISATLRGHGVGAVRVCDFSTGRFIETIRVWDEDRELMFTVAEAPPALEEWTPYKNVHPPHLKGYFESESADFRLVPLAGGGTRLEGTSVYRNHMWPSQYWQLWSDAIVTRVHRRVFEHVRQLAERDSAGRSPR